MEQEFQMGYQKRDKLFYGTCLTNWKVQKEIK
jgi:hypothetical protein